jgi:[ribosomal protein S5]-alanine N-acetyltransferase
MNLLLETPRLILRPLEMSDAQAMFVMDSNPNVHKYLWQTPTQDIEETKKIIEYVQKQYQDNNIGRFATILKDSGEFIGWTGIKFVNEKPENGNINFYDYGYRLNEKFWGKGYATEATKAWIQYAFNQMKIAEMNAYTHTNNDASNHILKKTGFNFMEEYTAEDGIQWNWWKIVSK